MSEHTGTKTPHAIGQIFFFQFDAYKSAEPDSDKRMGQSGLAGAGSQSSSSERASGKHLGCDPLSGMGGDPVYADN